MSQTVSPYAGQLPAARDLVDLTKLIKAYETQKPDANHPAQKVSFGTSGHRGSSLNTSFNEDHILAITEAVCIYRKMHKIDGPLFLGFDTHALSRPAFESALEVLAANEVTVIIARDHEFTPTPVISHAILTYNRGRSTGLADGIVITPSHNPPDQGGIKYNAVHGGPAEVEITNWIQNRANDILREGVKSVSRIPFAQAEKAATTHARDLIQPYIEDLDNIIDMAAIRDSKLKIGVDPMGGAGVHYWEPIADRYKLNLTVINKTFDLQFGFMPRDWDGQIRMDPSSKFAMNALIEKGSQFDIAFGCDADHDRHGIVTPSAGLMQPNHFLAAAIDYLYRNRPQWNPKLKIGKTVVSSEIINRVGKKLDRAVYEVPVGFKWFVQGLLKSEVGFAGEESAGASFLRKDGTVWTTDKDGMIAGLLAAEMTAKQEKDPSASYTELTRSLGAPLYERVESPANAEQRKKVGGLSTEALGQKDLGGVAITSVDSKAPGNGESIGGLKIASAQGWIALRPSGTEDIVKIYAESFAGESYLQAIIEDGRSFIANALG